MENFGMPNSLNLSTVSTFTPSTFSLSLSLPFSPLLLFVLYYSGAKAMKRRPTFTHIPDWLGIYHPGKLTINNPEFHYYISRSEQDQPVTLFLPQQGSAPKEMKMFYNIEKGECEGEGERKKDESGIKDFGYLGQMQEDEVNKININKDAVNGQEWIKKYEPMRFIDLLTDELHNRNVLTWLKSWDAIVFKKTHKIDTVPSLFKKSGPKSNSNSFYNQQFNYKKLILLAGPPGCGKTTLARVIARHCGYHYEEINASDDRSGKALIAKIDNLVSNQTIRVQKKPICVIIDEVDGALDSDENGIKEVLNYIQTGIINGDAPKKEKGDSKHPAKGKKHDNKSKEEHAPTPVPTRGFKSFKKPDAQDDIRKTKIDRPVIFICNDPYVKGLKQLRSKAIVVYFNTLQQDRVVKRLKEITEMENVYIESEVLTKICQLCNNDVRSAVGILELLIQMKGQLQLSAKEIMNRMRFSYIKDISSTTNEFLTKVMQPLKKTAPQKQLFKTYMRQLSQHDNHTLLIETFYHNFLNNNHICIKMEPLTRFYRELTRYDIAIRQNYIFHHDVSEFGIFPYSYYRIFVRAEEHKKIEFPVAYFEKFNKHKSNKALLERIIKGIPANLLAFISNKSLVIYYLYAFWLTMQTSSIREQDILRCVYKLLTYGIKLSNRNSPYLFSPQFDVLLTFGLTKPQINFCNSSRLLMQQNYEFLKMKSQLVGDAFFDNNKQNLESVINQLKKNRRKKRDSYGGQVKYKYLEGTGTEVKYDLKIGYFFTKTPS